MLVYVFGIAGIFMTDVYVTHDGLVSKYVHEDGSETAIKRSRSVTSVINPLARAVEEHHSDRNKYSVFVSSSSGCYMQCPFCHLTIKQARYRPLTSGQVLQNLKDSLLHQAGLNPGIGNMYLKLSWMGMGDALNVPEMVRDVSLEFIGWALEHGYCRGRDGVDLSTVLPRVSSDWIGIFQQLNRDLMKFPRNPEQAGDNAALVTEATTLRTPFRLFYSVHSAIQVSRDKVVPNSMALEKAIPLLQQYADNGQHSVILHHLLVQGLNDSEEELEALIQLMNTCFPENELRVLRYNFCARSPFAESDRFYAQIRRLSTSIPYLKVQVSPGEEVQAACGQFIVKQYVEGHRSGPKVTANAVHTRPATGSPSAKLDL